MALMNILFLQQQDRYRQITVFKESLRLLLIEVIFFLTFIVRQFKHFPRIGGKRGFLTIYLLSVSHILVQKLLELAVKNRKFTKPLTIGVMHIMLLGSNKYVVKFNYSN